MHRFTLLTALVLAPLVASAVPTTLSHQGRLLDATGAPLDGDHDVTFRIYDVETGGAAVYEDAQVDVMFDGGYYAVELTGVDDTVADGGALFLALVVDGGTELPIRVPINSVPYALRANSVSGGVVDASEIRVGGQVVIDGSGAITGAHSHDAADVDSGVLAAARLPAHNHDAAELTSGFVDMNRLPVGTGTDNVARGDHGHDIGQVTGVIDADSVGGVQLADLTQKYSETATISSTGSINVVHNAGTNDITATIWIDDGGVWRASSSTIIRRGVVSAIPQNDLRAYYTFSEGSGTSAADSSGNGNDATLQAGAGWAAGEADSAADFSGNSGYFEAPDSPSLDLDAGLTMAAWVYRDVDATTDHYIIFNKESTYEFALFPGTARLNWAIETTAGAGWFWHNTGYDMPADTWVHVAITHNPSSGQVITYIDGAPVNTATGQGSPVAPNDQVLRIGARGGAGGRFRIGRVDGAAIYGRPLGAEEVRQLMAASEPVTLEVYQTDNNTLTIENQGGVDEDVRVVVTW